MGRERSLSCTARRALVAVAIVVAVVAVPALDSALHLTDSVADGRSSASVALRAGVDPNGMLEEVESQLEENLAEPSSDFIEEVGLLEGARDVLVAEDGQVVGYLVDGQSGEVLERVRVLLVGKGWTGVSLGSLEGETYIKTGGLYRWLLVTTTQSGSATSVVLRSVRS